MQELLSKKMKTYHPGELDVADDLRPRGAPKSIYEKKIIINKIN